MSSCHILYLLQYCYSLSLHINSSTVLNRGYSINNLPTVYVLASVSLTMVAGKY